jgi:hypothetical protein
MSPRGVGLPTQGTSIFYRTLVKEALFYDTISSDPIIIVAGMVFLPLLFTAPYKLCCRGRRFPGRRGTPLRKIGRTTSGRADRIYEGIISPSRDSHLIGTFLRCHFPPQPRHQCQGRIIFQLDRRSTSRERSFPSAKKIVCLAVLVAKT